MTTDVGTLSAGEVVTDSAGNGSVTFTAPSVNTPASSASILAVPVGENLDNARGQIVTVAPWSRCARAGLHSCANDAGSL